MPMLIASLLLMAPNIKQPKGSLTAEEMKLMVVESHDGTVCNNKKPQTIALHKDMS